jgi:large-conductance mechanosensitive channel
MLSVYKTVHMKQHTCHLTYYRFTVLTFHRFTKALFKLVLVSYVVTFSMVKILQNRRSVAIKKF